MPGTFVVILIGIMRCRKLALRDKTKEMFRAILASRYYWRWNHFHMLLCEVSMICISFFPIYLLIICTRVSIPHANDKHISVKMHTQNLSLLRPTKSP